MLGTAMVGSPHRRFFDGFKIFECFLSRKSWWVLTALQHCISRFTFWPAISYMLWRLESGLFGTKKSLKKAIATPYFGGHEMQKRVMF